jgi:hypothetical protein
MDLERENGLLKDELASVGSISSTRKGQQLEDWLPGRGGGARHTLVRVSALSFLGLPPSDRKVGGFFWGVCVFKDWSPISYHRIGLPSYLFESRLGE